MTTRGGSRRDLYRAIEERDRIIAALREELASLREALNGADVPRDPSPARLSGGAT